MHVHILGAEALLDVVEFERVALTISVLGENCFGI